MRARIHNLDSLRKADCSQCSGVAHVISQQTTIGGVDAVSSAPCRACNPKGKIPPNLEKARAAGLPLGRAGYSVEAYPIEGYLEMQGLRIAIETGKGSKRRWLDPETRESGETVMVHDYGFIIGQEGADGDELDVYVGPNLDSDQVFVINQRQMKDKRKFDEHKVMLGFDSEEKARAAYLKNYDEHGPQMLGSCVVWTMERFKKWLAKRGAPKGPVRKALRFMVPL